MEKTIISWRWGSLRKKLKKDKTLTEEERWEIEDRIEELQK